MTKPISLKMFSCDEDELDVMYEEWRNCTDEFKEVGSLHHHLRHHYHKYQHHLHHHVLYDHIDF